jgi:hypothetical protein
LIQIDWNLQNEGVLKNIYRLKPIHSHTQPQQQSTYLQHRIMQVWKPLPKLPAPWREKYRLKYIMMKLQVQSERRGPLPRSCEIVCSNTGNQNFDILIFEILLFFGGLGEPSSAH